MRSFWQRGLSSLRKEIMFAIVLKLILIFILWMICFSNPVSDHLTVKNIQQHLLG